MLIIVFIAIIMMSNIVSAEIAAYYTKIDTVQRILDNLSTGPTGKKSDQMKAVLSSLSRCNHMIKERDLDKIALKNGIEW